jgi:hypothetical protein
MLSKFTSQNGRILPWKLQTIQAAKTDPQNPQNIELKEPIKNIGSFDLKIHFHPMLETPLFH